MDHLGRILDVGIVVVPLFLWLLRWAHRLELTVGLTKQVATKHLPYIYGRLKVHDEALNIESPLPPTIGLVPGVPNGG